jgi:TetR/AcrR family transcriptional regulator, tetracycline repressor protein
MELRKAAVSLDQEHIIAVALGLLREVGFHGFSMRALAAELGVTVGATYRHFGGKEKILEVAADRILSAIPFTESDGDWRLAFRQNARAYRATFREYPGVAAYLTLHLGETSVRQQAIEQSIGVLIGAGLPRNKALQTAAALNAYLRASAGDGDALPKAGAGRPASRSDARGRLELDEASFQLGLELFIGGIESLLVKSGNTTG